MRTRIARLAVAAVLVTGVAVAVTGGAQGYSSDQGGGYAMTVNCNGEFIYTLGHYWTVYSESSTGAQVGLNLQGSGTGEFGNHYEFAMYGAHRFGKVADSYTFTGKSMFFSPTAGVNVTYDAVITVLVDKGATVGWYGFWKNGSCYASSL